MQSVRFGVTHVTRGQLSEDFGTDWHWIGPARPDVNFKASALHNIFSARLWQQHFKLTREEAEAITLRKYEQYLREMVIHNHVPYDDQNPIILSQVIAEMRQLTHASVLVLNLHQPDHGLAIERVWHEYQLIRHKIGLDIIETADFGEVYEELMRLLGD